ncbi:MAG: M48 family metallopeptidase [Limnochordales bacterium]|nr:M48 family metallopeptidase [Limnochordales bacterium]
MAGAADRAEAPRPVEVRYAYGYRVEIYTAASARRTRSSVGRFVGDSIRLELLAGLSPSEREKQIEHLVRRLVATRRLPRLRERILRLAKEKFPEFNLRIGEIRFREQKRRWGSCSSRGNINLSYRLLDVPDELVMYVCIHELAHLIEFNHSPRFWALVERADPDYRIHREQLRQLEAGERLPSQPGAHQPGADKLRVDQYWPDGSGREAPAADEFPDD